MLPVRGGSSTFVPSWEDLDCTGPHAPPMSGLCACLSHTWPSRCVMPQLKVYLSVVRSLHIEQGFADPLVNCLRLQRVLRGIKRSRGDSRATRHPVTNSTMLLIFKSLDLNIPDHTMFWAACNLAYFGFLRSAEFTVPNLASFSTDVHLSLGDIAFDSYDLPTLLRVRLKASNMPPFARGASFTSAEAVHRFVLFSLSSPI